MSKENKKTLEVHAKVFEIGSGDGSNSYSKSRLKNN